MIRRKKGKFSFGELLLRYEARYQDWNCWIGSIELLMIVRKQSKLTKPNLEISKDIYCKRHAEGNSKWRLIVKRVTVPLFIIDQHRLAKAPFADDCDYSGILYSKNQLYTYSMDRI